MSSESLAAAVQDEQPLSVDEAAERYRDQWILMRVTERDEAGFPVAGVVVTTGRTRESIQPAVMEHFVYRRPAVQHFVFFGYRRIRSSEEWAKMLRQTTEKRRIRDRRRG
jgi:hypothetical protein